MTTKRKVKRSPFTALWLKTENFCGAVYTTHILFLQSQVYEKIS